MTESPNITVLLPVYNGERHVSAAIDSVLAQSECNFELLIGNDGSTDGTRKILAKYNDPRMRVLHAETNRGQFGNLNWLLGHIRTPLIKFLCHDDTMDPDCVAEHVKFFADHPDALMSMCQAEMFDEGGNVLGRWPSDGRPIVYSRTSALQLFLYHGCAPGNLSAVCVKRDAFALVGGFDETFEIAADYEMWVRICSHAEGSLGDLQKCLFRERHHSGRVSFAGGAGVSFVRENRRIRQMLLPLLPASVRSYAGWYVYLRPNVLDTHHFVACLRHGRFREARELGRIMGSDLLLGVPLWLLTANNHLYRPQPIYATEN
jgi:glycosyltransferase involved in cell wall biosynthesis